MKNDGKWRTQLAALGAAAACAVGLTGVASATYVITDLGGDNFFFNGGGASGGTGTPANRLQYRLALNNKNEVVGNSNTGTPYFWANGAVQKLTGFGASGSASLIANDINDSSVIVGSCAGFGCGNNGSVALTRNGPTGTWTSMLGIPPTPQYGSSDAAFGINSSGVIVGNSTYQNGSILPYAFTPVANGNYIGTNTGFAWAINDNGQVITNFGNSGTWVFSSIASETPMLLHSVDPSALGTGFDQRVAADINNLGTVVGSSLVDRNNDAFHATRWDTSGNATDLGTLSGDYYSFATAINESGVAVGQSGSAVFPNSEKHYAVIYQAGQVINLNSFAEIVAAGWTQLYSATDINEAGSIVGFGLKDGEVRAYLLTVAAPDPDPNSVPLPAPLAMLAFGMLGVMRWKRVAREV
jgi:probable HAF family extracellular repeat protein